MPKIFIVGDSFGYPFVTDNKLWPIIAKEYLEEKLKDSVDVVNECMIGTSQDFAWKQLEHMLEQITPSDYLVVVLTSPDRFWYFEEKPEYTNVQSFANIEQFSQDPDIRTILYGFVTRMWRHSLAVQLQNHRLGFLSYHVLKLGLRKPLIIKGFDNIVDNDEHFPELNFSTGSLGQIQRNEFTMNNGNKTNMDAVLLEKYWHHVDCRYNHLCLSNHKVLGNLVGEALLKESLLDLNSSEFIQNIIDEQNCRNKDLAEKELSLKWYDEMIKNRLRNNLGVKGLKLFF